MAHHGEPMDIDSMDSDFDNKENTFHHSNVLPCTEKGYEELDVSELNMKLRYSITPASSPMSKSYTAHCHDNRNTDVSDDSLNSTVTDNLTRSLNSTMTKNDSVIKSLKLFPLQILPTDQYIDRNRNTSVLRQLDSTITADDNANQVTVTISGTNDNDYISLPSSSSSALHTPEATTPTKDIPKDGGSPIMRGLKSVLNMFRSSQSPVPPEVDKGNSKHEINKPEILSPKHDHEETYASQVLIASTPIAAHRNMDTGSKRSSPYKDSIVFNDDLEKELQWKDETSITLSHEKVPIQKLHFQQVKSLSPNCKSQNQNTSVIEKQAEQDNYNTTLEYMDISYNDSMIMDGTMTEIQTNIYKNDLTATESDSEFLDCETTFSKNESHNVAKREIQNDTISNINTTQIVTTINSALEEPAKSIEVLLETQEELLDIANKSNTDDCKEVINSQDVKQNIDQHLTFNDEPIFVLNLPISDEPALPELIKEGLDVTSTEEITDAIQAEINESIHKDDKEQNKLNFELEPDSLDYNKITVIKDVQTICETSGIPPIGPTIEATGELLNKEQSLIELSKGNVTCDMVKLPADIPLPEEDETEKELDMTVDCLAKNIINATEDLPRVGNISNNIKLDETLDKSLMDVLSDKMTVNIENALLSMTMELSNVQNYSNQIDQNMSLDSIQLLNDINNFVECDSSITAKLVEQIETEVNAFQLMDINTSIYNAHTQSRVQNEIITLPCSETIEQNINLIECEETKTQTQSGFDSDETYTANDALTEPENESVSDIMNTTVAGEKNLDDVQKVDVLKNEIESTVLLDINIKDIEILSSNKDITNNKIIEVVEALTAENVSIPESIEMDKVETENNFINLLENNTTEKISLQSKVNVTDPNLEIKNIVNEDRFFVVPNTITSAKNVTIQEIQQNEFMIPIKQCIENVTDNMLINDEEIIVSANTSPFVSMSTGIDMIEPKSDLNFETVQNSLEPEGKIANAPPTSPAIVSKGYNFNFDEMDDPFATKTNIRMSPPLNTPNKTDLKNEEVDKIYEPPKRGINKNRRKSQPEKMKPALGKKKFNMTFDGAVNNPDKIVVDKEILPIVGNEKLVTDGIDIDSIKCQSVCNESNADFGNYELEKTKIIKIDDPEIIEYAATKINKAVESDHKLTGLLDEKKHIDITLREENETIVKNEIKNTSSSEQSTYYSMGSSSNESIHPRNVFNLPEIDDMNFNPFTTKSKMRKSPTPDLEINDPFATKSNMKFTPDSSMIDCQNVNDHDADATIILNESQKTVPPDDNSDKMETEKMEKETLGNISNTTCSSKATDDIDTTVREVHTEDEDTEEGPFLETDLNLDKLSDFDGDTDEMMHLNDFPTQSNDDNLTGEMFIDAEAFEFLLNQNKSNVVADSGKESLFLKFDPLFAQRMSSDGVLAALSKVQRRQQNTPTKATKPPQRDLTFDKSVTAGPSNLNITYEEDASKTTVENSEDLNVTVSKPMMVVTPAVNPVVTPRNKSLTPTRSNRHSITFTSPAMAVIDRLLSMSANNSLVSHDNTITYATREQNEADLALTQLRELLAEKEIHVYNLRSESKEMKDRLSTLQSQMKTLESETQQRLTNINELNGRLSEKTKINRSMAAVVEEYERTIASLIAEIEQDKKQHAEERMQLIKERDEQTAHLASMEVSFSDLHTKYEKSKQIILSCKANEDTYKKSIKECVENFNKMQNNYELLKQHATTKLNHANHEMEKTNRAHEAEVLKLNAMIKRKDLHITSLEETLTQKTKANEELTAICDELINKVG